MLPHDECIPDPKFLLLLFANCPQRFTVVLAIIDRNSASSPNRGFLPFWVNLSAFSAHFDCEEYGN